MLAVSCPTAPRGNCLLARPGCAAIRPAIPGGAAGLRRIQRAQTGRPGIRANLSVQPCKGNRMASETSLNADIEDGVRRRSEEHTSELQSLMRISYAVFCLKKKKNTKINTHIS